MAHETLVKVSGGGAPPGIIPISVSTAQTYAATNGFTPGTTYRVYDAGVSNGAWGSITDDGYSGFVTKATSVDKVDTYGAWKFFTNNKARTAIVFEFEYEVSTTPASIANIEINGVSLLPAIPSSVSFDPVSRAAATVGYTIGRLRAVVAEIKAHSLVSGWDATTCIAYAYDAGGKTYDYCVIYLESVNADAALNGLIPSVTYPEDTLSKIKHYPAFGSSESIAYNLDANFDLDNNVFTRAFDEMANVELRGIYSIDSNSFPSEIFVNNIDNSYRTIHKFPFDVRFGDNGDYLIKNTTLNNVLYKPVYGPLVIHDSIIENTHLISHESVLDPVLPQRNVYFDTLLIQEANIHTCHISNSYFEYFYVTSFNTDPNTIVGNTFVIETTSIADSAFLYSGMYDDTEGSHMYYHSDIRNSILGIGTKTGYSVMNVPTAPQLSFTFFTFQNIGNRKGEMGMRVEDTDMYHSSIMLGSSISNGNSYYIDTFVDFRRFNICDTSIDLTQGKANVYISSELFTSGLLLNDEVLNARYFRNEFINSTIYLGWVSYSNSVSYVYADYTSLDSCMIDWSNINLSDNASGGIGITMWGLQAKESTIDLTNTNLFFGEGLKLYLGAIDFKSGEQFVTRLHKVNIDLSRFELNPVVNPDKDSLAEIYITNADLSFTDIKMNNLNWHVLGKFVFGGTGGNTLHAQNAYFDFSFSEMSTESYQRNPNWLITGTWEKSDISANGVYWEFNGDESRIKSLCIASITQTPGAYTPSSTITVLPIDVNTNGSGTGAGLIVGTDSSGTVISIIVDPANPGFGYNPGDTLSINGVALGGGITDVVKVVVNDAYENRGDDFFFKGSYNDSTIYISGEVSDVIDSYIDLFLTCHSSFITLQAPLYRANISAENSMINNSSVRYASPSFIRRSSYLSNSTISNSGSELVIRPEGILNSYTFNSNIDQTTGAYTDGTYEIAPGLITVIDDSGGVSPGLLITVFGGSVSGINVNPFISGNVDDGAKLIIPGNLLGASTPADDVTIYAQKGQSLCNVGGLTIKGKMCEVNFDGGIDTIPKTQYGLNLWIPSEFLASTIYLGPALSYKSPVGEPNISLYASDNGGLLYTSLESDFNYNWATWQQLNPAFPTGRFEQLVILSDSGINFSQLQISLTGRIYTI